MSMITVKTLAKKLGISPQALGKHIRKGLLKAQRLDACYVIESSEAERFELERQQRLCGAIPS